MRLLNSLLLLRLFFSLTKISIDVTKDELDTHFSPHKDWCRCEARNEAGRARSNKATVKLANLRKNFSRDPVGGRFVVGEEVKLGCSPPKGEPTPTIHWLKDNRPLVASSNHLITDDGSLIIQTRSVVDSGNYTCVARNAAAKRRSHTASVKVGVNGGWSPWSPWSSCDNQCGINTKRRSRFCGDPKPQNGGENCSGESTQAQICTKLCPVDGGWTDWSPWSTCSPKCVQRRRRTCTRPLPHNSGQVCPGPDIASQPCNNGYCLREAKQHTSQYNSGSPIYASLMITLGILFLLLIITLLFMKYKKKRPLFHSKNSVSNKQSAPIHSCKECQGARLPIEFFSRPQCYLPPYAVHDPNWGYSNSLGQGSCSTNKLLISSSSSDLSSSKCEGLLRNTLETAISEPCRPATPQSCDASFQTRLKCNTV